MPTFPNVLACHVFLLCPGSVEGIFNTIFPSRNNSRDTLRFPRSLSLAANFLCDYAEDSSQLSIFFPCKILSKPLSFSFSSGERYWATQANIIQPGYPKNIHALGFPKSLKKIDAAVFDKDTERTLFFSGDEYWR